MTRRELLDKIEEFKSLKMDIENLNSQLNLAKVHYNKEVFKTFGFCDNQPIDVVQLFQNLCVALDA